MVENMIFCTKGGSDYFTFVVDFLPDHIEQEEPNMTKYCICFFNTVGTSSVLEIKSTVKLARVSDERSRCCSAFQF